MSLSIPSFKLEKVIITFEDSLAMLRDDLARRGFDPRHYDVIKDDVVYPNAIHRGLEDIQALLAKMRGEEMEWIRKDPFEPYILDNLCDDPMTTFAHNFTQEVVAGVVKAGYFKHKSNNLPAFSWPISHYVIVHF